MLDTERRGRAAGVADCRLIALARTQHFDGVRLERTIEPGNVVAGVTDQTIIAAPPEQDVVAGKTDQLVVLRAADQEIVGVIALDVPRFRVFRHDQCLDMARQGHRPAALPKQRVETLIGFLDDVLGAIDGVDVITVEAIEVASTAPGFDQIVTGSTAIDAALGFAGLADQSIDRVFRRRECLQQINDTRLPVEPTVGHERVRLKP